MENYIICDLITLCFITVTCSIGEMYSILLSI